ncbi:MAG: tetratricopeptide repeat protein [Planctomycetota bacterium]|nr:MAG: tetratricopeptide repeat protein [Planctomycetota bacterium]
MTEEPPTYESVINEAFEDHEGNFVGFFRELLDVVKIGLPEQLLVAARKKLKEEPDPIRAVWLRLLIADLHFIKRDLDSIPAAVEGIAEDESLPILLRSHAYYVKTRLLHETAQSEKAIKCSEKALELYAGDEDISAVLHINLLGNCSRQMDRHHEALEYFGRALKLMEKLEPRNIHSGIYNNIAITHMDLGNFDKAMTAYRNALLIEKRKRNPANIALEMSNIAALLLSQDQPGQALQYANWAFDKLREVEDNIARTFNLVNLAEVHYALGNFDQALEYIKQCLVFAESTREIMLLQESKLLHGAILAELKDEDAEERLKEALAFNEEVESGKPAANLERALVAYGKILCEKMDPEGYDLILKAERGLEARPQTPQIQSMLKKVRTIITDLPLDLKRR